MNLMDLVRRDELSPELRSILKEETSRVRAGSLDGLIESGGATLFPGWEDRLAEETPGRAGPGGASRWTSTSRS